MTSDMTCKEYAYMLLMQNGVMLQSNLEKRLREVYRDQCVDCILREIREDKEHVLTVHVNDDTPQLTEYDTPQETYHLFIFPDPEETA